MSELLEKVAQLPPEKLERFQKLLQERLRAKPRKDRIVRRDEPGPYPLAFSQRQLWILDQLNPGSPFYNISRGYEIEGTLRVADLRRALDEIVLRHEILRVRMVAGEDGPRQAVAPPEETVLREVDLSGLGEGPAAEAAHDLAVEEFAQPFDLARDPLLRCRLLRLGARRHLLLLTWHHIIFDGWSVRVFMSELSERYNARAAGHEPQFDELGVRFVDYALWEQDWLREKVVEERLAYWRRQLDGSPSTLELPFDRPRPVTRSYRGAVAGILFPPELDSGLRELSRRQDVSLFVVFLAALTAVFSRYSGQDDILLGEATANRTSREVEDLIGLFVNVLVLRVDTGGNPTFEELLHRVRQVVLDADVHMVPFEKVHRGDPTDNPYYQVLVGFEGAGGVWRPRLDGAEVRELPLELLAPPTSRVNLSWVLRDEDRRLQGWVEYSTDVFDHGTVLRLWSHLRNLLRAAVETPQGHLGELPMIGPAERHQILVEWNDTASRFPRRVLGELVARQAEAGPERFALEHGDERLSYRELERRSRRLAGRLQALGVGPETRVGLYLEASAALFTGILGIVEAGGAYVPLDTGYPAERLAWMVKDAQLAAVLTDAAHLDSLRQVLKAAEREVPVVDLDAPHEAPAAWRAPRLSPSNTAYVVYTSGSTGRPKGMEIPHAAVSRLVLGTDYLRLGPGDRVLQLANVSFDATTFELWGALLNGAAMVIFPRGETLEPQRLAAELRARRITALFLTTALFNQVAGEHPDAFAGVRCLMFGGEAVDPRPVREVLAAGAPERFLHVYGPSENTTFASSYRISRVTPDASLVPIGQPIANTTLYVLDRRLEPVPARSAGELYTGGPGLARGYLDRPALTAERFVPHPWSELPGERLYRTGDRVCRRPDGEVEFLGRFDHQVKVRGFRIELGEVEARLAEHPDVTACVVVVDQETPDAPKRLVAYVVARPPGPLRHSALRGFLEQRLPHYMVPALFQELDSLPLNANGKVDRRALPKPERVERTAGFQPPQTPQEQVIAEIWGHLLGVGRVGLGDDFYELGGNSLIATQVISRVRDAFQVEVPLRSLLVAPTVAGLAAAVAQAQRSSRGSSPPPLRPADAGERRAGALSFAQERFWFLHRLHPAGNANTSGLLVELHGPLRPLLLEACLHEILRRHEILRARFPLRGGRPVTVVEPPGAPRLPYVDLSPLAEEASLLALRRLLRSEAGRPFDLAEGPLVHPVLVRRRHGEHVLLVRIHHIVFDGWSQGIVLRELIELYKSHREGRAASLRPPPLTYADFVVWQRRWLSGEELERQLGFWRRKLDGVRVLELPADRPRPAVKRDVGDRRPIVVPSALTEALRALARRHGVTLYASLLALFKSLLARLASQSDFAVGAPIANRTVKELEDVVGCFVNTLVLRTECSGGESFTERERRVWETLLEAYAHQDLPFETIVESLQPPRDLSRNPLFQVLFSLQNAPRPSFEVDGEVTLGFLPAEKLGFLMAGLLASSPFDLSLWLVEEDSGDLSGHFHYEKDLFDRVTVERLHQRFLHLLEAVVAEPGRPLGELPLAGPAERHQMLAEWNDTAVAFPRPALLPERIRRSVAARGDAVAAADATATLRGHELLRRVEALARALRQRGVGPETRVGVSLGRSLDMLVAVLAVFEAGGAYVPLDPAYPRERIRWILEDSAAALLVSEEPLLPLFEPSSIPVLLVDRDAAEIAGTPAAGAPAAGAPAAAAPPALHPENLAYVIYTSGSTGRPKGVQIEHRTLLNFLLSMAESPGFGPGDTLLALTTLSFDIAGLELYLPLLRGGRVVVAPREATLDARRLAELIRGSEATHVQATPATWRLLVESGWKAPRGLRLLCGGEALPPPLAGRLLEGDGELWNLYGPTETTIWSTLSRVLPGKPVHVGRPIANTHLRIVDRGLRPTAAGVPGELLIGGDGLARGYFARPGLTAERFVPDPTVRRPGARLYRTGDLARHLHDGRLDLLGRLDHQVKVRGFRIETGEVEAQLATHPGIAETVVVTRESSSGPRLVAYFVARNGEGPATGDLREHLAAQLPEYMIPSFFVPLEALPRTPNGKVDRRALPAPEVKSPAASFVAPAGELERKIAEVWGQVLELKKVGVDDNFFDLGGHSLLMARIQDQLGEALERELAIVDLFNHPTVRSLARHLDPSHEPRTTAAEEGRGRAGLRRELKSRRRRRGGKG